MAGPCWKSVANAGQCGNQNRILIPFTIQRAAAFFGRDGLDISDPGKTDTFPSKSNRREAGSRRLLMLLAGACIC
jgi:hypothetical protein